MWVFHTHKVYVNNSLLLQTFPHGVTLFAATLQHTYISHIPIPMWREIDER